MDAAPRNPAESLAIPLMRTDPGPCSYLPGRRSQHELFATRRMPGASYQQLMDARFRRSGLVFYRPVCADCSACQPMRVPVATFAPSRSQRRVRRRNGDIRLRIHAPLGDEEHYEVYRRYQIEQHGGTMGTSREGFNDFLIESATETIEFEYRLGGRLAGAGIVDVCSESLSSVYFYFEPDFARRSLGVYSALCEIEECRRRGLPYWYPGYFVAGCHKMDYKRQFRPHELLGKDGIWQAETSQACES